MDGGSVPYGAEGGIADGSRYSGTAAVSGAGGRAAGRLGGGGGGLIGDGLAAEGVSGPWVPVGARPESAPGERLASLAFSTRRARLASNFASPPRPGAAPPAPPCPRAGTAQGETAPGVSRSRRVQQGVL